MKCRHCRKNATLTFIDLGYAPPSNAYLTADLLPTEEKKFPLRVVVCDSCWLVQTEDFVGAEDVFSSDYAYFSSCSSTWLTHAERYVADMVARFNLSDQSMVVEVAANDGYLLQYIRKKGIPCYGIEPTASTAAAARAKGIEIVDSFFGQDLAKDLAAQGRQANLMAANNVLGHVPDINDFVQGFALLLKSDGVATFEFPHLLRLINGGQFDTIYHEHYSYLSLTAIQHIFHNNGLVVFDVEELATHGGSLRVFAQRADTAHYQVSQRVGKLLAREVDAGMTTEAFYSGFQARADRVRDEFLDFLVRCKSGGKKVGAYGAAAKGNTLLNYAGIQPDLLPWVVDKSPAKQGKFLPGSHIPIVSEERIREKKPDYVVILPWNLRAEIMEQLAYVHEWGAKFVTAVPELIVRGKKVKEND